MFGLVLMAVVVGSTVLGVRWAQRGSMRVPGWYGAAQANDLDNLEVMHGSDGSPSLMGTWGNLDVRIDEHGKERVSVVVSGGERALEGLSIRPEHSVVDVEKMRKGLRGEREIEVGDPAFDAAFYIGGMPASAHALLDETTRSKLLSLSRYGRLEIRSGAIRMETSNDAIAARLLILPLLSVCAKRLTRPRGFIEALVENAGRDSQAAVRLNCLLTLARELPNLDVTIGALRAACSDPSIEIRFRAAVELGTAADEVLLELADERTAFAARAINALRRPMPEGRARTILNRALEHVRGNRPEWAIETACACIHHMGVHGGLEVDALVRALALREGKVAASAATALGHTQTPAAEAALIEALARDDAEVRIAAAQSLGRMGSVAAVLPLKKAMGYMAAGDFGRAARQAIAQIQSRAPSDASGLLSLASAETGQLSLSEAESGQLSLTGDDIEPPGELSDQEGRQKA